MNMCNRRFAYPKRLFDFLISALTLLFLSPLLVLLAWLVRIKLGGPIFFRQQRPGLDGRPFTLYKFRTMSDQRDAEGNLLPDAERLTKFGKLLRISSLDELPELWNVLKGEMSLVGPRPLRMRYLPLYSEFQARRHEVRPGITGWAQVNGRNSLSWEERFELDIWYVDNFCFRLDLKILLLTILSVVRREHISADGHETMYPFTGSKSVEETTVASGRIRS
jgi:lipopolysaccharide/colanic/teichoic acid biosynthesis glycosyltransferase